MAETPFGLGLAARAKGESCLRQLLLLLFPWLLINWLLDGRYLLVRLARETRRPSSTGKGSGGGGGSGELEVEAHFSC